MIIIPKWAVLTVLCVPVGAIAERHSKAETRNHQAHVHGEVSFNIAQEGDTLVLAISAPGADIVGFEHAPTTAQEKALLQQALVRLAEPEQLFVFDPAAQCQLSEHLIKQSLSEHGGEHLGEGEHHNQEDHAAFEVSYQYHCQNMASLTKITTNWFKDFQNTEEIHVNLLTEQSQKVIELTAIDTDINF